MKGRKKGSRTECWQEGSIGGRERKKNRKKGKMEKKREKRRRGKE